MALGGLDAAFSLAEGVDVVEADDDSPPPLPADGIIQHLLTAPATIARRVPLNAEPVVVVPASTKAFTRPPATGHRPIGVLCQPMTRTQLADGRCRIEGHAVQRVFIQPLKSAKQRQNRLRASVEHVAETQASASENYLVTEAREIALVIATATTAGNSAANAKIKKKIKQARSPGELADVISALLINGADEAERRRLLNTIDGPGRLRDVLRLLKRERAEIERQTARESQIAERISSITPYEPAAQAEADKQTETTTPQANMDKDTVDRAALPFEVYAAIEEKKTEVAQLPDREQAQYWRWIEIVKTIPWKTSTPSRLDINTVDKLLDQHFVGMKAQKRRILEWVAIQQLGGKAPAVILLDGPPGIGKTAFGQGIAEVLGRKFAKISMAGIEHPFELGGNELAWKAPGPGLLIEALRNTGVNNPVILLDEIDKAGRHDGGNPLDVLLSAMDPEQNERFVDRFVELPVDFRGVTWILTSNDKTRIPAPLLDRAEIIRLQPYTRDEQLQIARAHFIPNLSKLHGLKPTTFCISDEMLEFVVGNYQSSYGLRDIKRHISSLMRAASLSVATSGKGLFFEKRGDVLKVLGTPKQTLATPRVDACGTVRAALRTPDGFAVVPVVALSSKGLGRRAYVGLDNRPEIHNVVDKASAVARSLRPDVAWDDLDITTSIEHSDVTDLEACLLPLTLAILSAIDGVPLPGVVTWGWATLNGSLPPSDDYEQRLQAVCSTSGDANVRVIAAPPPDDESSVEMHWLLEHVWTATSVNQAYELATTNAGSK